MDKTQIYLALSNAAILLITVLLLGGIASLIRVISIRRYARSLNGGLARFIDNRLTFIGVIHHELSHALLALITGAKIKSCKIFKIENDTLGSVNIIPRGPFLVRLFQQAMTGIAPVVCGSMTLYVIYYYGLYLRPNIDWITVLLGLLAMSISYHMSMSKQDVKVARGGLTIVYLLLVVISFFIKIDYVVYRNYLVIILGIMLINLIVTLFISAIASITKK